MFKRKRITREQGLALIAGFLQLDIQRVALNLPRALEISHTYHLYAYDAYVLECAERLHLDLVTLDTRMQDVAQHLCIPVIEV
jgi:predicted nucleic acid-binding protein